MESVLKSLMDGHKQLCQALQSMQQQANTERHLFQPVLQAGFQQQYEQTALALKKIAEVMGD